jgi:hypothetical protein
MDPYLEAPDIWPDFHDALANEMRGVLNQTLPPPYYARLEMRPEIGVVNQDEGTQYKRRIVPDVSVAHPPGSEGKQDAVAVLEGPRTAISPSLEITVPSEQGQHTIVEIRDPRRGHRLVTLIEIVSPSCKHPGADRRAYQQKHREVYNSDANLIELDLLRGGDRVLHNLHVESAIAALEPPPDYLVLVNRAWQRAGGQVSYQIFAIGLRELLPCIPVPLREGEPEVPLDLQYVVNRAYDSGPYRRGAVNYGQPPEPPLREADVGWAAEHLHEQGSIAV